METSDPHSSSHERSGASPFTLYTTPISANGRKVLAAVHHLGLEPEIRLINVYKGEGRSPAYLAINPSGKIPTLVDGDLTLWESNAILQYLSEAHGDYRLWSREPKRRADIARWLYWEASQWQPSFVPILSDFVKHAFLLQGPAADNPQVDWGNAQFQAVAKLLDGHLSGRAFIAGDELTLADFSVGAMMMYVRPAGFPFDVFPNIGAWFDRFERVPAWQASAA